MDTLNNIVLEIQHYLSDYILIVALGFGGIWFSFRTGFIQVRGFKEGMRRTFGGLFSKKGDAGKDGMSSFQALATAIAAQVGTGNIAGAATAIAIGGPGAIFWMWVAAFLGMATIYCEAIMAQKYKKIGKDGVVTGGPVYYIRAAFQGVFGKVLAAIFAVLLIFALGFMGNAVQSNSIAASFHTAFGIPQWITGIVIAVICLFIFTGGMKRIAKVTELIVPLMAALYIAGSLIIIFYNWKNIPTAFYEIFVGAFAPEAIAGGAIGATISKAITKGVARGLFSNEAGMGSTPHAHAQANVKEPHEQGCVAMIGVFIDTFVVLTLNSLIVICTLYTPDGPLAAGYTGEIVNVLNNTNLAQTAFGVVFGADLGAKFVAVALFFFAFSTILSWNMFGKVNTEYLFGKKGVTVYTIISLIFIFLGTTTSSDLVWALSDMFNQLMVLPNVIGLVGCTALVVSLTKFKK